MKIALMIAGGVVALLGVGGVVVSMQPDEMHVERAKVMAASPAEVWPYLADMRKHQEWSPWADLDPNQTLTYSDPTTGVGAWYAWDGNDAVGSGKTEFTEVVEGSKTVEALHFKEPWESEAVVAMTLEPTDDGTKVTWTMDAHNDFAAKMAGMFMDMDAMLGADFTKGLDRLAVLAEKDAEANRLAAEAAAAEAAAAEAAAAAAEAEALAGEPMDDLGEPSEP